MAIFFNPNPAAQPNSTLSQWQLGDIWVSSNGGPVQLTYSAVTKKNSWTKYTTAPIVGGLSSAVSGGPPVIASTLVPSTTVTGGQSVNFKPVTAYGGSAVASSYTVTGGTVTGLNITVVDALGNGLPNGLTATTTLTTKQVADSNSVVKLYNSVDVTITGTAPNAGLANTTYTVTFTDATGQQGSASFSLLINPGAAPLSNVVDIASRTLTQGTADSFKPVRGVGGDAPLSYTIFPVLPTGLSISSSTGIISGTPTVYSVATDYTVTIRDNGGVTSAGTFNMTVLAPAVVATAVQANVPSITRNVSFTAFKPVNGSGGIGTLIYSAVSLPAGMSINTSTGYISGPATATTPATSYSIVVTDSNTPTPSSASASVTITVSDLPILNTTLSQSAISLTKNSQSYSFTPVSGSGGYGTLSYAITSTVSLSSIGLTFNTTTGQITGNPTALLSVTSFTVTVSDQASQTSSKSFTIEVLPGALSTKLDISNKVTVKNVNYSPFRPVSASGGDGSYTFSVTPDIVSQTGFAFNTSTGYISGTPTSLIGDTAYTIKVTDQALQESSKIFTLRVEAPPVLVITAIPSKTLVQYDTFTPFIPVTATGGYGNLTYSISPLSILPAGLIFSASTGEISGSPTKFLTTATTFSVTVNDQAQQVNTATFLLTVNTRPLVVKTDTPSKTLIRSVLSTPYRPVSATGGSETYAYAIDNSLPSGVTFNTSTGIISGTPTVTSTTATYSVTITDTLNVSSTSTFSLNVVDPPPIVTTSLISSSTYYKLVDNISISPVAASGGYGSISFSINPDVTDIGLTFRPNGVLSGIPTQLSNRAYTISATDSIGQTSSTNYFLTITYAPISTTQVVTTSTLIRSKAITSFIPVTSVGGSGGTTFSIDPTLTSGLSFDTFTGRISGTPLTTSTLTTYSITAKDSDSNTSTKTTNIIVNDPPPIVTTATTASLTFTVGQTVSGVHPVTASGGDGTISYVIGPTLTAGLTFDSNNGTINGTPVTTSTAIFYVVTATDSLLQSSSTGVYITINPQPVSITVNNSTLVFTKYSSQGLPVTPISASGGFGQITYQLSDVLPAGLLFNNTTGEISGTPSVTTATTSYSVLATDTLGQINSGTFTLRINDVVPDPLTVVAAESSTVLEINQPANLNPVTVTGGVPPYTYAISSTPLPTGLTFNADGSITGTPTATATITTYTITVTDHVPQSKSADFSLSVVYTIPTTGKGYTGSRGYTGSTGTQGITGFTGSASTATGYTGSTGTQGVAGFTGSTGTVGFTGSKGDYPFDYQGTWTSAVLNYFPPAVVEYDNGLWICNATSNYTTVPGNGDTDGFGHLIWLPFNRGFTGSAGAGYTGSTGTQGEQGYWGSVGYTGSTGTQGETGFTGSTGTQGEQGYWGSVGYTGSTGTQGEIGFTGSTGTQGDIGFTGSTGTQGEPGYWGSVGYTGSTGTQGDIGFTGSTGTQGETGFTGSTGTQGDIGFTGSTGTQGETGFTGSVGADGYWGSTGYTGSKGDQGTPGTSVRIVGSTSSYTTLVTPYLGAIGDGYILVDTGHLAIWTGIDWNDVGSIIGYTGSQGIQGYTGSTGTQGNIGFTGSQGDIGFTGSQGINGGISGIWHKTSTGGSDGWMITSGSDLNFSSLTSIQLGKNDEYGNDWSVYFGTYLRDLRSTNSIFVQITDPENPSNFGVYLVGIDSVGWNGSYVYLSNFTAQASGGTFVNGNKYVVSFHVDGFTGYTGSTGTQGDIGFTGSTGTQGEIGFTGSTGTQGDIGFTGSTGTQGITGFTGSTGTQGITGFTGSTGTQGITGFTGSTGTQGIQGITGFTGSTGTQGVRGYTGSTGTQGITGFTGSTGTQGITGFTGSTGTQGEIGFTGSTGTQGITGFTGSTGTQGEIGFTGSTGTQGITGFTGSMGVRGYTGSTGTQGNIGFTGSTGTQGVTGFTGSTGTQGEQGYWGSVGYTGSTGTQGAQGYTGSTGTQGVTGFTGSTGTQGVRGYTGSKGDYPFDYQGTWTNTIPNYFTGMVVEYANGLWICNATSNSLNVPGDGSVDGFDNPIWLPFNIGYTGSTGTQGIAGYTGSTGTQGVTGFTGSTGTQGEIGFTGSTGTQGDIGFTGSTGTQGITGFTGSTGTQGDIGFTGSIGDDGVYVGPTSPTNTHILWLDTIENPTVPIIPLGGTEGQVLTKASVNDYDVLWSDPQGFMGSVAGFTGSTGTQGETGFTGSTGTQGVRGYTGSTGTIGYTGSLGSFTGTTAQVVYITNTTAATSTTTGAIHVVGGAGIGGNLYVGNSATILSTLGSTSSVSSNALYIAGGVGIAKSLLVTGEAIFRSNVTFAGTSTFVLTTNTVYTDNVIELHYPNTPGNTWTVNDGKDIGFRFHYYNGTDTNAALILANDSKYLEWYSNGVEDSTSTISGGVYGTFKTGSIILTNSTASNSTSTGALTVTGGVGIGGGLYVGDTSTFVGAILPSISNTFDLGSPTQRFKTLYVSSSTIDLGGTKLTGSADGSFAVNKASITEFIDSTSTNTGALIVVGGVGIGGALNVATTSYINSSRILTAVDLQTVTHTATYITNNPGSVSGLTTIANTTTVYGTYDFGTVSDVWTFNDYNTGTNTGYYSIHDAATQPAFIVYIGFEGITEFNRIVLNINYTQSSGHTQDIDLYNYVQNSWDTFTTYSGSAGWFEFILGTIDSTPYISSGKVTARVYHVSFGNTSHRTWIDYIALEKSIQGGQGPRGATGATGATGFTGSTGTQGNIGFTGSTGTQGVQGITGFTGSTGTQGIQGITGFTGSTGTQGVQGITGFTGSTGTQGIQGITGFTGSTGTQGVQGITGFTGSTGTQGVQGITGFTGSTGTQGVQGITGFTGSTGTQGVQGITGFTGSTGTQGVQGITGFTGSTGTQGVQGITGFTGSTGTQGIIGLTGSTGTTGFTGSQGVGFTGSQGSTGTQGITGFTGSAGSGGGGSFTGGTVTYITTFTTATNSTSTITGAVVVTGGVGIGGNLYVGGAVTATSAQITGAATVNGRIDYNAPTAVEYFIVAGGGGGGQFNAGGGGAGGLLTGTNFLLSSNSTITVSVGAGGAGGSTGVNPSGAAGSIGSASTITGLTTVVATGGGGGGAYNAAAATSGGSGGGAGAWTTSATGGSGTTGQGKAGGNSTSAASSPPYAGAGGGGAGFAGQSANPGAGGTGTFTTIISTTTGISLGVGQYITATNSLYFAGGGGGGGNSGFGIGGPGGGGAGGTVAGVAGIANSGGGGGGGGNTGTGPGGNGGSGIVIMRYPDTYAIASSTTGSPSYITTGGYKIYVFSASGTITWGGAIASTSPTTGALVVTGGLGVGGDIYSGGTVTAVTAAITGLATITGRTDFNSPTSVEYLIVAGGGAGGYAYGGGGGAGGYRTTSNFAISAGTYAVTVGAGGAAETAYVGNNGNNSQFSTVVATGGGSGAQDGVAAGSGGSGGGGNYNGAAAAGSGNTPSTSPSQGNNGGAGDTTLGNFGGGGGGAGAVGYAGNHGTYPGVGGVGLASSISGVSTYYAGGGGGWTRYTSSTSGGLGGGGQGKTSGTGGSGTANSGGGGGSTGYPDTTGAGGSGIVIIRYADTYSPASSYSGGSYVVSGGYRVYTFLASGTITWGGAAESNGPTSGSLVVSGGVGVGGNLNVAGTISASNFQNPYLTGLFYN